MSRSRVIPSVRVLAIALVAALAPALGTAEPLDLAARDTTCSPCRDFYQYANGRWLASVQIPPAYASYGSFRQLTDRNQVILHELLEQAAKTVSEAGEGNTWKLGAYYGTCMDSVAAEAAGVAPIQPLLDRIAALPTTEGLAPLVGTLHAQGTRALFRFTSGQDPGHSEDVIAVAGQGGLGMPDRDYYTRTDSTSRVVRAAYAAHVTRTFILLGQSSGDAKRDADAVMTLETALAKASMTNVERRDPKATYHRMTIAEMVALAPRIDWKSYLAVLHVPDSSIVNVQQPEFIKALDRLVTELPIETWRAYLRWCVVDDAAPLLSRAFVDEDFDFQRRLTGAKEPLPRWRRCLTATDQALGEALGQLYVRRHFTPDARTRAMTMVSNLEAALKERLAGLEWMGPETRTNAIAKLEAFDEKIGFPDRWRDYSALTVDRGPFVLNRARARSFEFARQLAKIGRPLDRTEWNMTPPTVNAYYSSGLNSINFPAGIMQPPFFDPAADDAVNYGGMGAVIGHEMTHGFDDRGRQFDARGNLRDWWTERDAANYKSRAQLVIDQFDGYVAVDSLHLNGRLTLGENIADLGGIAVAYAALERTLAGKPRTRIGGLTPEQRFFLSWARVWREKRRPEDARTHAQTNSHSAGRFRVNGPLSNLPEFAKAWGCKAGDPMVRPREVQARIW